MPDSIETRALATCRVIIDNAKFFAIITTDLDGVIVEWNSGAEAVFGWTSDQAVGRSADIFFTPEDRAISRPKIEMQSAIATGRSEDERWHIRQDGRRIWANGLMMPVFLGERHIGYLKIVRDETEKKQWKDCEHRAAEQQILMLGELNHRVKNTLATVQSIASQTVAVHSSPTAFREAFEARLLALAKTHDLLTEAEWKCVELTHLLNRETSHYPDHFTGSGPEVKLDSAVALALGMVFHELATNAAKYGALSQQGLVRIDWVLEAGRLSFTWREEGGPPIIEAPTRRGFGTRLIHRTIETELEGEVDCKYAESGLTCIFSFPFEEKPT